MGYLRPPSSFSPSSFNVGGGESGGGNSGGGQREPDPVPAQKTDNFFSGLTGMLLVVGLAVILIYHWG